MKIVLVITALSAGVCGNALADAEVNQAPRSEVSQQQPPQDQEAQVMGYICRNGLYWCTLNLSGPLPVGSPCMCNTAAGSFAGVVTVN